MIKTAPAAAGNLLNDALLARLRGQDELAVQCEESAHQCDGYTPMQCINGLLLPAATRHAQFERPDRMGEMLARAREHAGDNPLAHLRVIVGTGTALGWLGDLVAACVWISAANGLIAPLAVAGVPGYADLWMHSTRELEFAIRRLRERNARM
jgi:hypothetical protein